MLTFRQRIMQCCHRSLTQFHSPPPHFFFSESSTHSLSESSTLCSLSSSTKSLYPVLQKTNISVTSHRIFADLNVNTTQWEVIDFSPFIRRKFVLKPVSVWLCFSRQQKESTERGASFRGRREHNRQERRLPRFAVRNAYYVPCRGRRHIFNCTGWNIPLSAVCSVQRA